MTINYAETQANREWPGLRLPGSPVHLKPQEVNPDSLKANLAIILRRLSPEARVYFIKDVKNYFDQVSGGSPEYLGEKLPDFDQLYQQYATDYSNQKIVRWALVPIAAIAGFGLGHLIAEYVLDPSTTTTVKTIVKTISTLIPTALSLRHASNKTSEYNERNKREEKNITEMFSSQVDGYVGRLEARIKP